MAEVKAEVMEEIEDNREEGEEEDGMDLTVVPNLFIIFVLFLLFWCFQNTSGQSTLFHWVRSGTLI